MPWLENVKHKLEEKQKRRVEASYDVDPEHTPKRKKSKYSCCMGLTVLALVVVRAVVYIMNK